MAGNRTYFSLSHMFCSKTTQRKSKIKIYKIITTSIVCCGSETWVMTETKSIFKKNSRKDLLTHQRKWDMDIQIQPGILLIVQRNTYLRIRKVPETIRWAGHELMMEDDRLAQSALDSKMQSRRRKGRPWKDGRMNR